MAKEDNSMKRLIEFLKKNKGRTVSESEAVAASGIAPNKIGPALWEAEPIADPSLKMKPNKGEIVKARKNGIRWERIARRAGISVAQAQEIGGTEAMSFGTGRGRKPNGGSNGGGPAKAASGRRQKAQESKASSGRRAAAGGKGKDADKGKPARARTRAERQAKAGSGSPK